MEQNKNAIGYKLNRIMDQGQVVVTLKSGVQVKTAPEPLEDARMSAEGFQILTDDHEHGKSPAVVKSTADLFINLSEIAAIEVITL